MATLFTYLKGVQRLLHEQRQDMLSTLDLTSYVNEARREIAARTQCVRRLTPISGSVISATVLTAGTGLTNPVVAISSPDFPSGRLPYPNGRQATALPIVQGGTLTAVNIQTGGDGYFQPTATVTDPTGSGATVSLQISPINKLNQGQEVYNFSDIFVGNWPGVDSVYAIINPAIIYANYRYMPPGYSFSEYQAKIRTYPFQYQYVPAFWAQYGQGADGSIYFYPYPSQSYQVEYDCLCLPSDLIDDQSVDVIPLPWSDTCKFYAAHLAYNELQNLNAANYYLQLFDTMTLRKSNYARPARAINRSGRY